MNVLLILAALRPATADPAALLTRVFAAVSIFSLELQLATWSGLATIRTLAIANGTGLLMLGLYRFVRSGATKTPRNEEPLITRLRVFVPSWPVASVVAAVGALALALNLALPLEAADPYHLQRVDRIERAGTLAYDLSAHPKVNGIGWTYEAVLADIRQIPAAGAAVLRLHGVGSLLLYVLSLAAVRRWLPAVNWYWIVALVIPVVFHQFVLVKNDLFGALPAIVVLAWLVVRAETARPVEMVWAGWLAGFAIAVKLTSFPLALVVPAAIFVVRRDRLAALGLTAVGAVAGAICGGLAFTLIENVRWYGSAFGPFAQAGADDNRNTNLLDAAGGVGRFAVSLLDLGLITRSVWPGRGGWGSTFGLPLIWALVVLAASRSRSGEARRALWIAASYFLLFALVYADADIAHRLALAPGVMLVVVAAHAARTGPAWMRRALVVVIVASALQIARSAFLYISRAA
jgi:hypothetical protein